MQQTPTDPTRRPADRTVLGRIDAALARVAQGLIRGYQRTLSPLLGRQCRFHPTCSEYGREAFATHGFLRGARLTLWRLLRCQPFARSGFDPVPAAASQNHECSHHATH